MYMCNRELCSPDIDVDLFHAVELLKSVHNIIIEMLWKWLREKTGHNLREVILQGKSNGIINYDLPVHRYVIELLDHNSYK